MTWRVQLYILEGKLNETTRMRTRENSSNCVATRIPRYLQTKLKRVSILERKMEKNNTPLKSTTSPGEKFTSPKRNPDPLAPSPALSVKGRKKHSTMEADFEEILHHLGCRKPFKSWDKLPTSTGDRRISSINSTETSFFKKRNSILFIAGH